MKIHLLLFAHGKEFICAKDRVKKQAIESNFFDNIVDIDTTQPPDFLSNFIAKNHIFFEENDRGYGNWIWKPFLVNYVLENFLEDNDILIYIDSGCEISKFGKKIFKKYIKITDKSEALFFSTGKNEKEWTKRDLFDRLGISYDNHKGKQIQATFFFLKKTTNILSLTSSWLNLSLENNYHFINESNSALPNVFEFIEHRHDQSILSLLNHHKNYPTLKMNMCFEKEFYHNNSYVLNYPIHAIRNKSNISVLNSLTVDLNLYFNLFSFLKYFILRLMFFLNRKIF
jgi:hypothetical protein